MPDLGLRGANPAPKHRWTRRKVSAASAHPFCCLSLPFPQSLTEEKIASLLQLLREELELKAEGEKAPLKLSSEALPLHVSACVLALCGWTCG